MKNKSALSEPRNEMHYNRAKKQAFSKAGLVPAPFFSLAEGTA